MEIIINALQKTLMQAIARYAVLSGLPIPTVCQRACGSRSLYRRIDSGAVSFEVASRVFKYLDDNPPNAKDFRKYRQKNAA